MSATRPAALFGGDAGCLSGGQFLEDGSDFMHGFSSIGQMALAIRGRWKLAAAVAAAVALAVCLIAALLPPRYAATAWVVFNNRGSDAIVDKNDSLGFGAYVNGEVDLIGSRRVIQRVAQDPVLLADPRTRRQQQRNQKGKAPLGDWLVDWIGRNVTVASAKGTRTVSIQAEFDDPVWAATVANRVARSYLDTAVDLKVTPARANVAFFRSQAASRAAELTRAQQELDDFLRATGMTGLEAKSDSDDLQLRTLAERLGASQVEKAGSSAQSSVGGADAAVSAGTITNPVVQQLRGEIASQSATLRDLTVLSGPNYPAVAQARARLDELRGQLAVELGKITAGVARNTLAAGRESAAIGALAARKRQAIAATAANRSRLQVLGGNVDRAKANYDAVAARLADVELQSAVEAPSAAILSPAAVPRGPSFPYWPLIVLLAAAAGITAGVIAALIKELLVPRVRSGFDLQQLLGGAPVLCDLGA